MPTVPITPAVLAWAVAESGLGVAAISERVEADVSEWIAGSAQPTLGQLRMLSEILDRPVATFFLERPPSQESPKVKFRHMPNDPRDSLNFDERKAVREALRQQRMLRELGQRVGNAPPSIPAVALDSAPVTAAAIVREWLGASVATQLLWGGPSKAFQGWREHLEQAGIFVFVFGMGADSIRGFSIFDDEAPVIAVNTGWSIEARTFSLFHELGHLVTRTSSACAEAPITLGAAKDTAERWCERFAAHLLLPREALTMALAGDGIDPEKKITDLDVVTSLARKFRVSARAAAMRLIEEGAADWELYRSIPAATERNPEASGGKGRTRATLRRVSFGRRATSLYFKALAADLIGRHDISEYLNIPDSEIDDLQRVG